MVETESEKEQRKLGDHASATFCPSSSQYKSDYLEKKSFNQCPNGKKRKSLQCLFRVFFRFLASKVMHLTPHVFCQVDRSIRCRDTGLIDQG